LQNNNNLICKDIKIKYPQFELDIDFTVKNGQLVSLLGPSGCGKTTTLSLIAGIIPMQKGTIYLNGRDITFTEMYQRKIGMVFQDYALFPNMNVKQNLAYPLKLKKISKTERDKQIKNFLATIGLSGFGNREIEKLSGGEKQRIAIGRALASSPDLLLLDEPLSALDANLRNNLKKEIKRIQRETNLTTVYVTHDRKEALSISDEIIVMKAGHIQQKGTPEEIYNKPINLFVANFIGDGNNIPLKNDETLFFRPENVTIQNNLKTDFITFNNVKIITREYQGEAYTFTGSYKNSNITFYYKNNIEDSNISIYVAKNDTLIFRNGKLIEKEN